MVACFGRCAYRDGRGGKEGIGHRLGPLPFHLQEESATEHWGKRMPMGETTMAQVRGRMQPQDQGL